MGQISITRSFVLVASIWSTVAVACPPPPPPEMIDAPVRLESETDTGYFDRLGAMQTRRYGFAEYLDFTPPSRLSGEDSATYEARIAAFRAGLTAARTREQSRRAEVRRAELLQQEEGLWESAPQVVLVQVVRQTGNADFAIYHLRIIDRLRGADQSRRLTLHYAWNVTSCGVGYQPPLPEGARAVLFAGDGVLSDNISGIYSATNAQSSRTVQWIDGQRPDGSPVPTRRR
jgi:hypothetical protein